MVINTQGREIISSLFKFHPRPECHYYCIHLIQYHHIQDDWETLICNYKDQMGHLDLVNLGMCFLV